jgi:hypothetical protein
MGDRKPPRKYTLPNRAKFMEPACRRLSQQLADTLAIELRLPVGPARKPTTWTAFVLVLGFDPRSAA